MNDTSLMFVINLLNAIWETCKIPLAWKQSVNAPVLKPAKTTSDPSSYKLIALTSHIGKVSEIIITERLTYFVESRNLLSSYQSGFRKGRITMDPVLCPESDIWKEQTSKE